MKRFLRGWAWPTVAVLLMAACSSNSTNPGDDGNGDGNNPPGGTSGAVTMTFNGTPWTSEFASASTVRTGNVINSLGVGGSRITVQETFAIGLADLSGITTSTYAIGGGVGVALVANYFSIADTTLNASLDPSLAQVGTVTISEINQTDGYISGTFEFDLHRIDGGGIIELRNGTFTRIPFID